MNQIESRQESLTKLQKRIANFVMSDPIQAAFMTVDQLSHAVGVSTATVVRFSTELGYNGYTEFQRELQEYLKNRAKPSSKLKLRLLSWFWKTLNAPLRAYPPRTLRQLPIKSFIPRRFTVPACAPASVSVAIWAITSTACWTLLASSAGTLAIYQSRYAGLQTKMLCLP